MCVADYSIKNALHCYILVLYAACFMENTEQLNEAKVTHKNVTGKDLSNKKLAYMELLNVLHAYECITGEDHPVAHWDKLVEGIGDDDDEDRIGVRTPYGIEQGHSLYAKACAV